MAVDLKAASAELESKLADQDKKEDVNEEHSITEMLGKALDYILGNKPTKEETLEKSETEAETEDDMVKSEKEGADGFYKSIVESPVGSQLQELIDSTPVIEELTDQIAKSVGGYEAIRSQLSA